ncbi:MAG: response regulator [Elusimicrobiales bacterium]
MRILIVDDERDARRLMRTIAERADHQVIEAENGEEGLRLAAEQKPDLIISDALMPVMDGFYFLREVKKHPLLKNTPFVFYSATYTEDEDIRLALSMGADDYIVKPQEPEQLWADIGRALERHTRESATSPAGITPEAENEHLRKHTQIMALKLEKTVAKLKDALDTQKKIAEALAVQSEEMEKFFSVALDLLCILDERGCFRLLSPSWERALGYSQQELIGSKVTEFIHPDDVPATSEAVSALAAQKEVADFINRHRCKDGTYRWLEWRAAPAGRLIYAAARDITQQRQAIQEQQGMCAKLAQAQKMEAVGRLAGGVAHDFNNLLTAIEGYTDLLLKRIPTADAEHADIEEIKKAAERAAALTRQLLTFSRKQESAPRALIINDVIRNLDKMLRRLIGEDFEIALILEPALKQVMADPSHMEQVIVNLMINARDSMPKGGRLTIETHNVRIETETVVQTESIPPGDYAQLVITDTGLGMDAETRSHIFEPFFTTKGPEKGTGLGLATVFGIVKQSRGYIFVCSEVGIGTTVKIYLPVSERTAAADSVADTELDSLKGTETILIAEDEEIVLNIVCRVLRENGYKVIEANDGEEALRILKGNKAQVHAAVIDLVMPKLNGKELAEMLGNSHPETKVIFMSGYTDDFIRERMKIDPGIPFIQKPISAIELLKKVRQAADSGKKPPPAGLK